jgi:hypothetical protein
MHSTFKGDGKVSDVERLKRRFHEGRMSRETYLRSLEVLRRLEEMDRCWLRVARASLGGHVK